MLTILEYALVRLGLGAVRLAFRALELVALAVFWGLGVVLRLALRPLTRELAYSLGWLREHSRRASRDRGALR